MVVCLFWAFALLRVFELPELPRHVPALARVVFLAQLACIVALLAFAGVQALARLGAPATLFMASSAAHLFIGGALAYLQFSSLKLSTLGGHARNHVVAGAAFVVTVLGTRMVIDKWGTDRTIRGVLLVLMLSCAVTIVMPVWLWNGFPEIPGVTLQLGQHFGAFTSPMISSFVAGSTAVIGIVMLDRKRTAGLGYLALTLGVLAVAMSFSKGGMFGFIVVFAFLVVLGGSARRWRLLAWTAIAAVVGTVVLARIDLLPLLDMSQAFKIDEFLSLLRGEVTGDVLSGRDFLWSLAWEKYAESPILGSGYGEMISLEGAPLVGARYQQARGGAHNHYLGLGGEAGIFPVLFFLLALLFVCRPLWTLPRSPGTDVAAGVAVLLFFVTVVESGVHVWHSSMFVVAVCCAVVADAVDKHRCGRGPRGT